MGVKGKIRLVVVPVAKMGDGDRGRQRMNPTQNSRSRCDQLADWDESGRLGYPWCLLGLVTPPMVAVGSMGGARVLPPFECSSLWWNSTGRRRPLRRRLLSLSLFRFGLRVFWGFRRGNHESPPPDFCCCLSFFFFLCPS